MARPEGTASPSWRTLPSRPTVRVSTKQQGLFGPLIAQVPNVARRSATFGIALLIAGTASAWVLATEHRDAPPSGHFIPRDIPDWPLSRARAAELREDA